MGNNQSKSSRSNRSAFSQGLRWLRNRKLLIPIGLLLAIIIAWPIYESLRRTPSPTFGQEPYQVKVHLNDPADFGGELKINLVKISHNGPSDYKVDFILTYKNGETASFSNAKEGGIFTYPRENGYDIKVVKALDEDVIFAISRSAPE